MDKSKNDMANLIFIVKTVIFFLNSFYHLALWLSTLLLVFYPAR